MRTVLHREPVVKLLVVLAIPVLVFAAYVSLVKEITVVADGDAFIVKTVRADVGTVLAQARVVLGENDVVDPSLTSTVRDGDTITVHRAFPVKIVVDGEEKTVFALGGTVADVLQLAQVTLGDYDRVAPALVEQVAADGKIVIVRVEKKRVVENVEIPFRTKRWAEPKWYKGKVGVLREGIPGEKNLVYELTYEDGVLVDKRKISERVTKSPRDKIIGIGTKPLFYTLDTPAGTIRYTEVKRMEATAYYWGPESTGQYADGLTATGVPARYGVVAVDPKVIPLGTQLYIPGYGIALAADVGGAIKGNRIDLCFNTYREAVHFGRKTTDVYILMP